MSRCFQGRAEAASTCRVKPETAVGSIVTLCVLSKSLGCNCCASSSRGTKTLAGVVMLLDSHPCSRPAAACLHGISGRLYGMTNDLAWCSMNCRAAVATLAYLVVVKVQFIHSPPTQVVSINPHRSHLTMNSSIPPMRPCPAKPGHRNSP